MRYRQTDGTPNAVSEYGPAWRAARCRRWIGLAAVCGVLLGGCGREEPGDGGEGADQVHRTGALTLSLHADLTNIDVAGQVQLTLEASAPESFEVRFPPLDDELGGFTVETTRESPGSLGEGNQVRRRMVATLEPFLPGEYEIPGLPVAYTESDAGEPVTLRTDPVPVTVRSMLAGGDPPEDIHDITGPISLAGSLFDSMLARIAAAFVVVAAAAALVALLFRRRRRGAPAPPAQPPHEKALQRQ